MLGTLIILGIIVGCLAVAGLIMRCTVNIDSLAGNIRDD